MKQNDNNKQTYFLRKQIHNTRQNKKTETGKHRITQKQKQPQNTQDKFKTKQNHIETKTQTETTNTQKQILIIKNNRKQNK